MAASSLLLPLLGCPDVAAIFADDGRLQAMLDFEAALAAAEAGLGVIPAEAAATIAAHCRVDQLDLEGFADEAARAGNLAIPLVKRLTARVAATDREAARFVHWGATSQDAIDTGLVLQLRSALDAITAELTRLADGLAALAAAHRHTVLAGRTWLQQALPITFGLKAAGWLDAVERHRQRLAALRPRLFVLQFGGAAGSLASLGERGLAVAAALAGELELGLPDLPWHGQRDRFAELGALLGLITGTLGKIARDLSLLMQTEVGEAFEQAGAGRGGSSTMPHKRNPVTAAAVLAAAARAPGLVATLMAGMVQEHERGLGGWHAEWIVLPELVILTAGALDQTADAIAGLELDPARMRANLELTNGLVMAEAVTMALGAALGRLEAHHLVEAACRRAVAERRHLRDVLADEPAIATRLDAAALDRLFDPTGYLGVADSFIDRVLAARQP
jgi:3-carboxy-cis,cis-muconate cycloisomerase